MDSPGCDLPIIGLTSSNDKPGEQNHWSERGRVTSVGDADALGRPRRSVLPLAAAHLGEIRHLMKKAPNGQFLSGAFALSLTALLTACRSTPTQTASDLKSLQGYWQGEGGAGSISINITGNSLNYYARPDQWYKTTFTLPAGTDPKQLLATIKDCGDESPKPIGEVVASIYKIENGTLTFASPPSHNAKAPKSFPVFTWIPMSHHCKEI